jgi:glutamate synthase (NADPH/NADH) small chain
MGKPTGFIEIQRKKHPTRPVDERIHDWREVYLPSPTADLMEQGARCMDCGIPFCHQGCPLGNLIPDWNDLVYKDKWRSAIDRLHATNNFPEFTGRLCPAPCEGSCVLGINDDAVTIKDIEVSIIDRAYAEGWVTPQLPANRSWKKVAVVGSGPAGLAAAQQLARVGHAVTVFEKNDALGGLLRYGIPDFKMEKSHIDRRIAQMQAEGVVFRSGVRVGDLKGDERVTDWSSEAISADALKAEFDAIVLTGGAERSRDLPVPGRDLAGIHFAMEFLPQQNKVNAGGRVEQQIRADGQDVIVIGGGDTGSDCVGTSNRHGAKSVTQFELMPMPPDHENKPLVWPYWPTKLRTSSSHEEGCEREFAIATKEFIGEGGKVKALKAVRVDWQGGKMVEVPGTEQIIPAGLVLLAMGFVSPVAGTLEAFGVERDARGNARAQVDAEGGYATNVEKVFAAGDMRRGQSLVVWAIREGRQAARAVDEFLMGSSKLPR